MYLLYFFTLIILFLHLLNWLRGKTSLFPRRSLNYFFLIFVFTQILSTIFSIDPHTSFFGYYSRLNGGLLSLLSYSLLFLILPLYLTPKSRDKITNIALFSGLIVSTFGILEHFGIDKNYWVQDVQSRVFSTLGQPNWLAAYLCILLPLSLDKFINSHKFIHRFYFLFLLSNFYLCLLFTKSKSGIIAALISLGIYFFISYFQNKKNQSPFSRGIQGVLPLIIFIILSLSITNPIKDQLFPSKLPLNTTSTSNLNITPSGDIRKIVWAASLDLWHRFPLIGTGPETFAYTYYWVRPAAHNLTSEWDFLYNKAHNEYLNYLATTGTLGFIAYLSLIIAIIYSLRRSPELLTAYLSILITNFAGFSVVVTSLFFFLLPSFNFSSPPALSFPKNKFLLFPLLLVFFFLLKSLFSLYLADISYAKALAYSDSNLNSAQSFINSAISLNPAEALYFSQASLFSAKAQQNDSAVEFSQQSIKLSPFDTNIWKQRAQVFSLLSYSNPQYFTYAIDALEKCSRLAPTDAKTFYLLGKFYEAASQKDLALKNYLQAVTLKPNYDYAYFALGEFYFDQKNYSQAQKYFDLTLKYAPTNTDAQNYLQKIKTLSPKSR